ncbi:Coq4-domain-containing protein [Coniophora puteana RWD-64-598 SS2]|uniref:4-hydroxy-3-methoxy-5-polyprenylbenzoate decarboxylase n=1 Tax=Coniophora puteana (strain RWD-64-598) TaxID=741705 RepID=A0A5M3MZ47_CONPW|nr:Coq4-domain-containing protein [Coniophora puteana RWD-64-598 SS2]EIW84399.1 Coq4-domain-containing protein [Coniophora puteana RWD-64-598 SS2]
MLTAPLVQSSRSTLLHHPSFSLLGKSEKVYASVARRLDRAQHGYASQTIATVSRSILRPGTATPAALSLTTSRKYNTGSRLPPAYPGHIPLSTLENGILAVGSAVMAFLDPRRADMVAALGETTAGSTLVKLRDAMLESPEGRRILRDRPRIHSTTINMDRLRSLPNGTWGRAYVGWLDSCRVTPDSRDPVHYISDPELAYVMQRYRETHDFYHALFGLRVNALPELAVKAFEFTNLGFPMTAMALGAAVKLKPAQREKLLSQYIPWAVKCGSSSRNLLTVYWEKRWEQDLSELHKELGVWNPPA